MTESFPLHLQAGRLIVVLVFALLMSGCARTPPVSYYQLSATDTGQTAAGASAIGEAVIGVGPVRLPEFLDRPQIIIRMGSNRVQLVEGHRWAEPLAENIPRVLRENLAARLGTERIQYFPWNQTAAVDLQIPVEILRFEGEGYKEAHLEVIWSVQGRGGKKLLPQRRAKYQVAAAQADCEGLVQALSRTLALLSREIAEEISRNDVMDKL
jgi:uncharacterized protein